MAKATAERPDTASDGDRETAAAMGWPANWRELQERAQPFRYHSGHKGRRWGVFCDDPAVLPAWWRLESEAGRPRTFASSGAAMKAAARLNVLGEVMRYAKKQADYLREYYAAAEATGWDRRGWDIWEGVNRYAGVRASLWGSDPFGLFTADLTRPFNKWDCPEYRAAWEAQRAAA